MELNNIDHVTYDGTIEGVFNDFEKGKIFNLVEMWVDYSIESDGTVSTVSLTPNKGETMISFNYQDLKKLVEGKND